MHNVSNIHVMLDITDIVFACQISVIYY